MRNRSVRFVDVGVVVVSLIRSSDVVLEGLFGLDEENAFLFFVFCLF